MNEFRETMKKLGGECMLYHPSGSTVSTVGVKITFNNGYNVLAGFKDVNLARTVERIFEDAENDIFLKHSAVWMRYTAVSWWNKVEIVDEPFDGDFSSLSEFFMKAIVSGIF